MIDWLGKLGIADWKTKEPMVSHNGAVAHWRTHLAEPMIETIPTDSMATRIKKLGSETIFLVRCRKHNREIEYENLQEVQATEIVVR
jgi:hypothetical protein